MIDATEVTLKTISKGEVPFMFHRELKRVIANIMDVNTKATTPRKITMEFTITPYPDRSSANVEPKCRSSIAEMDVSAATCTIHFAKKPDGEFTAFTRDIRQELLFNEEDMPPDGKTAASGQ